MPDDWTNLRVRVYNILGQPVVYLEGDPRLLMTLKCDICNRKFNEVWNPGVLIKTDDGKLICSECYRRLEHERRQNQIG